MWQVIKHRLSEGVDKFIPNTVPYIRSPRADMQKIFLSRYNELVSRYNEIKQELSYGKQIARQLHNTMTLKSGLEVTQCH